MCDSVDAASAAGVVVVASAGNSGDWGNPAHVPGACSSTVTVSALAPSFDRTYWSSFDGAVDVAAPGLNVLSVDSTVAENSPTPHLSASGTSMASPVVAGVAALLSSAHPGWTSDQIADQLRDSAQDLGVPGRDPDTGTGIVDAAAALGVVTPQAEVSDFFDTWAERVYQGTGGATIVSWTTPQGHAVTGYTVTVHAQDGTTTDYDVDGLTVRTEVSMRAGEGWTVTAHTTSGDVTTYPSFYRSYDRGAGEKPERFSHVRFERARDHLIVSWDKPEDPDSIDRVLAHVQVMGGPHIHARFKVDHDKPFPRDMRVKLPHSADWRDVSVSFSVLNTDDNGDVIGGTGYRVKRVSPAVHGSHIQRVLGAGPHAAEVTGGVSRANAERVCDNSTCVGEVATLVIDRGRDVQRVPVRYNSSGDFHTTIWIARGATNVKLRIEGPKRLDSGSFQRIDIEK